MKRRLSRQDGRVPYSLVALVVLSSIFTLSVYFEQVALSTTSQSTYDVPGMTQMGIDRAESEISAVAQQDLMNVEVSLLGAGANPQLNLLNQSLNTEFTASMASLGFSTPQGLVVDNVVIRATSWGINATFSEGTTADVVPHVGLQTGTGVPLLPLASQVNSTNLTSYASTELPLYPMVVGHVMLTALDGNSGELLSTPYDFSVSVQSEIGLLEAQSAEFSDASWGSGSGLAKLVSYILTSLAELRALSGYGSGGYPGYQAGTVISGATGNSILSSADVHDAESLAVLLESVRYFRSFDGAAVNSLLSSLPPGPYEQLLARYVFNGTIDPATLYLLFLDAQGGWSDGWISSGAGLASAIYGFADRFKFDLLQRFWGNATVDPTLLEPVASWPTVQMQGMGFAQTMLLTWLWDYGSWLGVTQQSLPPEDSTAVIPPMVGSASDGFGNVCTYVLFPGGTIETSNPGVPNLADLILGTPQVEQISIPGNPNYNVYLAPNNYQVWENVSIDQPSAPYAYLNDAANGLPNDWWIDFNENSTYITTHDSLLLLFNPMDTNPYDPGAFDRTLHSVLVDLSNSMQHKSSTASLVSDKGYLDYVGLTGDNVGGNSTITGTGMPDLSTTAGRNTALNTSYSYLTQGTSSMFGGPFSRALSNFSVASGNPANRTSWWVNGASHPALAGSGNPTSTVNGGVNWTMSAISSYPASEWFQMLYTLYYGSGGTIPAAPPPLSQINYNNMDQLVYNILSPGVEQTPPTGYQQPNFAVDVMNETFISVYCWITGDQSNYGNNIGCGSENGGPFCPNGGGGFFGGGCLGDTANSPFNPQANGNFFTGACNGNNQNPAFQRAINNWYLTGTGGLANMWTLVGNSVMQSLQGGVDQIHQLLQSSWQNVYNNTGNADWSGQNFTNWILRYIAPPILNDTSAMGTPGGWLNQIYRSTDQWLQTGTNLTGTVTKMDLNRGRPYSFSLGNASVEGADGQIFNESLRNMTFAFTDGTLDWSVPQFTVHLVDPQNDSSNMGIAPYETSWSVSLQGSFSVVLTSSRESLISGGVLQPTVLNLSIPVHSQSTITVYTPWPLGSGWDPSSNPLPGDPTVLESRALLGLEGHDYHSRFGGTGDLLPGIYPSVPLDNLLLLSAAVGRVSSTEGHSLAELLAGLPEVAAGRSAQWSQNLTTLELTTNSDLAATAGPFLSWAGANFSVLSNDLSSAAQGGVPSTFTVGGNGFFGYNATVNTDTDVVSYFVGQPAGPGYNPSEEYALAFGGSRVGDAFTVDNPYVGANPGTHGFSGTWGTSTTGAYALTGNWQEFGSVYSLSLSGPARPGPTVGKGATYPELSVPYLQGITGGGYPATVSVQGVGGIPSAALTAFGQSLPASGTSVTFPSYVAQETYAGGRFYNALVAGSVPSSPGITSFGYSTDLTWGGGASSNYSLALVDPTGALFSTPSGTAASEAFLLWLDNNAETLGYSLGAPTPYLTILASIPSGLLSPAYRNVTMVWQEGLTPVSAYAWSGPNMAALEANLGGSGGGMGNSPTLSIGGGVAGGWGFTGTLTG